MHFKIDLNLDAGERTGVLSESLEAELYAEVSSINIACGGHAGDPSTMKRSVELGIEKGVAIGAHPSFPDRDGFGRRPLAMEHQELVDSLCAQVSTLKKICEQSSVHLHHLKPHGALYNLAAFDQRYAQAVIECVHLIDPTIAILGLAGSPFIEWCREQNLGAINEAFADRRYTPNGELVKRDCADAIIQEPYLAAEQALKIVLEQATVSNSGSVVKVSAETICIHGDHPQALAIARRIRTLYSRFSIEVTPHQI